MTGFQSPDKLRQHRPLLLALEAIGWLHMTGKAKIDFLREHGGQKNNYDYKKWHELVPWDDRLKWVRDKYSDTLRDKVVWPQTLTEFITKHADGKSHGNLVGLLQAGHAMASGIEKQSFPQRTVEYLGQDVTHMWLSTAFGHPVSNLLADPPELLTEAGWKRLLEQIEGLLAKLKELGDQGSSNDLDAWQRWRDGAVGSDDGWLRKAFTSTLAETRLPNNDVTLFDQSYVAAALFKSAAAGAILEGSSFPWASGSLKQQTRWQLLTIGIGADHFETRAVKIGDWTGARLALDKFFFKVRRLIEVDLAVGSLLYADGEVHVFSFPGERFDHQKQGGNLDIGTWKNWLAEQIDDFARDANLETPPYCSISEPPSRALVGMTEEIQEARKTMAVPLHRDWNIAGEVTGDGHVCPVCLVRRNGDKSSKQTPCKTCKDRRTGRLDKWLSGELEMDTIWITEVADRNDRVALITMSLDIGHWLDGTRLDALRTQSINDWSIHNSTGSKPLPQTYDLLVTLILTALTNPNTNNGRQARSLIQTKIATGLKDENKRDVPWDKFYELMVEDRADAKNWDDLDDRGRAMWLAHQLFRKLASPGRIYRFQWQAEDFFKTLLAEFREIAAADRNRWRTRRSVLESTAPGSWTDRNPYKGRFSDTPLDLLYIKDLNGFITISNMSRILEKAQDNETLKGKTIQLKDDENRQVDPLTIKAVKEIKSALGVYHPVIPLECSPVRFRVLLPLESASACVDRAVEGWNEQFSRVWDRLPLRIGVVAFPRKTPFQAVIEEVRNIEHDLDRNENPEIWRVAGCETREGVAYLNLNPLDGQSEILKTMPIHLPDGREDVFYPYMAVEDNQVRFPHDFRHPEGQVYRHVKDLRDGEVVHVYPSLIATVFMDSTAIRFETVTHRQLAEWQRMRDLWRLIDRSVPGQTALRGAWSELARRRDDWHGPDGTWLEGGKETWLDLVRAVFHKRLGIRNACLETILQAVGNDLMDWCLEWHMKVLKKQVSGLPERDRVQTEEASNDDRQ
jgi:CRISPR-associated Csx11 family protein